MNNTKTIVVTDSGIGGISVVSGLCRKFKKQTGQKAKVVFFNALFDQSGGYHKLKGQKERVEYFNKALLAMDKFSPDCIVIACNTLSVLYPYTSFAKRSSKLVLDVISPTVKALKKKIKDDYEKSSVIVFAQPITIKSKIYKRRIRKFMPEKMIVGQSCRGLVRAIEEGEKEEIKKLIKRYVKIAVNKVNINNTIYIVLGCTHFSYFKNIFKNEFKRRGVCRIVMIDPNSIVLKNKFFDDYSLDSIEIISKVKINFKAIEVLKPKLMIEVLDALKHGI